MPAPRINKGVFGGPGLSNAAGEGAKAAIAGAEQDLKEGQARNLAREERDYIKSERAEKQLLRENAFVRENYEGTQVDTTGVDEISADVMALLKENKTTLAGLDRKDPKSEIIRQRIFSETQQIQKSVGSLANFKATSMEILEANGGFGADMPPGLRDFALDYLEKPNKFRPKRDENGKISLWDSDKNEFSKDSNGNNRTLDSLKDLKVSKPIDLNALATSDAKNVAKQIREVQNQWGGSKTFTNTGGLIDDQINTIVSNTLKMPDNLRAIAAKIPAPGGGFYDYEYIKENNLTDAALRKLITPAYVEQVKQFVPSGITTDGVQSQEESNRLALSKANNKSTTLKWKPDEIKNFESTISSVRGILNKPDGFSQEGVQRLKNLFPEELARIKWKPADKEGPARIGYKGKADAPYEYFAIEDLDSAVNAFSRLGGVPQLFINNNSGGGGWRQHYTGVNP